MSHVVISIGDIGSPLELSRWLSALSNTTDSYKLVLSLMGAREARIAQIRYLSGFLNEGTYLFRRSEEALLEISSGGMPPTRVLALDGNAYIFVSGQQRPQPLTAQLHVRLSNVPFRRSDREVLVISRLMDDQYCIESITRDRLGTPARAVTTGSSDFLSVRATNDRSVRIGVVRSDRDLDVLEWEASFIYVHSSVPLRVNGLAHATQFRVFHTLAQFQALVLEDLQSENVFETSFANSVELGPVRQNHVATAGKPDRWIPSFIVVSMVLSAIAFGVVALRLRVPSDSTSQIGSVRATQRSGVNRSGTGDGVTRAEDSGTLRSNLPRASALPTPNSVESSSAARVLEDTSNPRCLTLSSEDALRLGSIRVSIFAWPTSYGPSPRAIGSSVEVALSSILGARPRVPTVLAFGNRTCRPCSYELPLISADSIFYRDRIDFFGIFSESDDIRSLPMGPNLERRLANNAFPMLLSKDDERVVDIFGRGSVPALVYIGREGLLAGARVCFGSVVTRSAEGSELERWLSVNFSSSDRLGAQ